MNNIQMNTKQSKLEETKMTDLPDPAKLKKGKKKWMKLTE